MKSTTTLGSGDKAITVGKIGHGLMMMTWKPTPVPDEVCFEAIKASLDSVPPGTKMVLNSGEFYGINPREANLELIARFLRNIQNMPIKRSSLELQTSNYSSQTLQNLKRSVDRILEKLRGTKRLDLFEPARVDKDCAIEDTIRILSGFVAEGKFDYIGLSECKASTLKRANAIHPIAAVEIEVSPWSYEDQVKEVIAASQEVGAIVCAYSPLGRGFLSGRFKSLQDLEDGDIRRHSARFQEENMKHNQAIVDGVKSLAEKKGITPAQLCITWVSALGPHVVPIPGSSNKERTDENMAAADIPISTADVQEVQKILDEHPVKGGRYGPGSDEVYHLWG
ncbi:aldo/keto reductase [Fomitiporia mediterranea MF3/22]|uniref:aldo/keto reductase n=1 Tax=Fomitiporia mediterranea (strain MF3/22) TaxID=694068 RepID=UPI00044081EE|nr:aldo/keto reductase [Fomitiporia mediterranea MF3/22]EJD07504.1 aldo/keto reductase [Fomitiporia mediterranea MF3/22]